MPSVVYLQESKKTIKYKTTREKVEKICRTLYIGLNWALIWKGYTQLKVFYVKGESACNKKNSLAFCSFEQLINSQ